MSFRVLPFHPSYQEETAALAEEILCREFGARVDLNGEPDLRDIAGAYAGPDNRFVIALDDNRVVGGAGVQRLSDHDCELKHLYVMAEHRREGVASAMALSLLEFGRERGYDRILYELDPELQDTAKKFARYGFLPVPDSADLPRPGDFIAIQL
jgi:GNAT superfamily N-acetyltransferase